MILKQILLLLMSLVQPEDYLKSSLGINHYWNELLRTVDEFDQLIELEKRQIATCVKEYYQRRLQLVRQFSSFKDSMRYEGEVQKKEIYFVEMSQFGSFFKNYHQSVVEIIEKVILEPTVVAQLISLYPDNKRIKFEDFLQNIVFNVYPCYLPSSKKGSPLMLFMRAVLRLWPYNPDLMRPTQYTLLDQAISGFMKAPEIVCYVEKIVSRFLSDASSCHMSAYAFDSQAIKNEIQVKRQANATFSLYNQPKKSFMSKFKNLFSSNKDDMKLSRISNISNEESFISDRSEQQASIEDMMKKRQLGFFELIRKTADNILSQQPPLLLCKMMACFDDKLTQLTGQSDMKPTRLKHYCYFLMTNLILSQLHSKFTVSHQEGVMSPADLQNISQIIKILNCLFQGITPQSDKQFAVIAERYQNISLTLGNYRDRMTHYYRSIIDRGKLTYDSDQQLFQMLLTHCQSSLVISLNDFSIIIALLQNLPSQQNIVPERERLLHFLNNKENADFFDAFKKNRPVKFKNVSYSTEHIYFLYQSRNPSFRQVIDYYLTVDQPLADLPLIREILLRQSNLKLQQALQIDQDFKLIHRLPLKQIKGFLTKMAQKFKHLRVRDGKQLQSKFQQSFRLTLGRSLRRKQWLLYYRNELNQRLACQQSLMRYFTQQLNSVQFYDRMATLFCDNVKLKIYLNIENNLFRAHQTAQDLKKIQISTLMVAKDDSKTSSSNQNYILRNSFKLFESVKDILRCIAKNEITKASLSNGRAPDEFNTVFQQICDQIVSKIGDFVSQRHIMQVLSQQKLASIVVRKLQDVIYKRYKSQQIKVEKDRQLLVSSTKINHQLFWEKDLSQFGIDRQFLVSQGVEKFSAMVEETNVTLRLKHFGELFKIIFTVLGFTLAKNKISAQIVTPLVQYIILQCPDIGHYECLFSLLALKWRQSPEDSYHLTLYQSSLTYIRQLMPKDYPLS